MAHCLLNKKSKKQSILLLENMMKTKRCTACGGDIQIYYDNEVRDDVYCNECEREYRIISMHPVKLQALETDYDYCFEEDEY